MKMRILSLNLSKNIDAKMIDQNTKKEIQTELNSLAKHEVFGYVVQTTKCVKPIGYRWVFL